MYGFDHNDLYELTLEAHNEIKIAFYEECKRIKGYFLKYGTKLHGFKYCSGELVLQYLTQLWRPLEKNL